MACFFAKKGRIVNGVIFPILVKYTGTCVFYKIFFMSCSDYCFVIFPELIQHEIKVLIFVSRIVNAEENGNRKYQNKKCAPRC